jgi:hypothetical protein
MEIKFCESGDKKVAIGTGVRPIRWCRACYVTQCGDQFEEWNVVISHRELGIDEENLGIACARTGETITSGTVWLDPVETNIAALVYAGFIEPVQAPKSAAKAAKTEV